MSQKQINPRAANRLGTFTIWSLLLDRYHNNLQVADNGKTYPRFAFNLCPPPKRPTRIIFNPDLMVIPCGIMANSHEFYKMSYKEVGAAMRCNMMGNIT